MPALFDYLERAVTGHRPDHDPEGFSNEDPHSQCAQDRQGVRYRI